MTRGLVSTYCKAHPIPSSLTTQYGTCASRRTQCAPRLLCLVLGAPSTTSRCNLCPIAARQDWALLVDRPAINAVAAAAPSATATRAPPSATPNTATTPSAPAAAPTTTSPSDTAGTKPLHVLQQQEHGRADGAGSAKKQQQQAADSRELSDVTSGDLESDDAANGCPVVTVWRDGREVAARAGAAAAGAVSRQLSYYGHGPSAATEAAVPPVSVPVISAWSYFCAL